jgi:hypothetical protein
MSSIGRTRLVLIAVASTHAALLLYASPAAASWVSSGWNSLTHPSAKNATKAIKKGIKDVGKAGQATAKYFDQQRRLPFETLAGGLHQANVGKSLEYLATNPLRQTNKNAQQAMKSSQVLAAAAAVAASAYGGPAGAAAFAAWTTYNATGDLSAALKVGVTQGLIASATAGVASMPAGADKIAAQAALKAAVTKVEGGGSEEARQAALGSLFASVGNNVNAADLNVAQRTMAMAAIGGAAVAASGGNRDAIRSGFLQGGGKVLVQGLKDAQHDAANTAKNEVEAYTASILSAEQIAAANQTYENVKNTLTDSQVAQLIDSAKKEYVSLRTTATEDVAQRTARLTAAHNAIIAQRDRIQKENERASKDIATIRAEAGRRVTAAEELLRNTQKNLGAAEIQESAAQGKAVVDGLRAKEASDIEATEESRKHVVTDAEQTIAHDSESVREDVVSAIRVDLQAEKIQTQSVLDDGTIVSWDASQLRSASNSQTSVWLAQPKAADELLDFYFLKETK